VDAWGESVKRSVVICGLISVLALAAAAQAQAMGKPRVAALQIGLTQKGAYHGTIDGYFGPSTERAVRLLQRRAGIAVDGVPGPRTRRALGRWGRHGFASRVLHPGLVGWDVSMTQFMLAWHGFPSGRFDGAFGKRTARAVAKFQRFAHLPADGLAGPATFGALQRGLPRAGISLRAPLGTSPTDGFGPRGVRFHSGLDYPADRGTPVQAAASGRVVTIGWDRAGYGRYVVVKHAHRNYTWYAHLSRVTVRAGALVSAGTTVGRVGASGDATGPHLHFELRVRGAAVDPRTAF
jgi:peptidoglycan hydrolase-like protein with peptidoglycan-binding domain